MDNTFFCFIPQASEYEFKYIENGLFTTTSRQPRDGGGGEGYSIVFHLSFLTHSACQYDVT